MEKIEGVIESIKFDKKYGQKVVVLIDNESKILYAYLTKAEKENIRGLIGKKLKIWYCNFKGTFFRLVSIISYDRIYHITNQGEVVKDYNILKVRLVKRQKETADQLPLYIGVLLILHLVMWYKYRNYIV